MGEEQFGIVTRAGGLTTPVDIGGFHAAVASKLIRLMICMIVLTDGVLALWAARLRGCLRA